MIPKISKVMVGLLIILAILPLCLAKPYVRLGVDITSGSNITYNTFASNSTYNFTYDWITQSWLANYSTFNIFWYNMTTGTSSSGTFNETYDKWSYNQTYTGGTFNETYDKWAYNETYIGGTYNSSYDNNLIWGYNQTYTDGTFNATYDSWSYNQTFTGSSGISNYSRAATLIVCANNTQDKLDCDYLADGVADQEEINSAIRNTSNYGGRVLLMDGIFVINDSININKRNITLEGQGKNSVILLNSSINRDMDLIILNDVYITLNNFKIDGNKVRQTTGTNRGVYYNALGFEVISNLNVVNCRGSGIYGFGGRDLVINNYVVSNDNNGIESYGTANLVSGNIVEKSGAVGILAAVTGGVVSNNMAYFNTGGGILNLGNNGAVFANGLYSNSVYGIKVNADNCHIVGNNILGIASGDYGIYSDGKNYNLISGNYINNIGRDGIFIQTGNYNNINSNTVSNIGRDVNNKYSAILIQGNCSYNIISGNNIYSIRSNRPKYGILENSTNEISNFITNNYIINTTNLSIFSNGTNSVVFNNIGYDNHNLLGNIATTGNITASTGFFTFLGSLVNRITTLFVQDIDATGNVTISGNANISQNLVVQGNLSVKRPYWNGYDNSTQPLYSAAVAQVINVSNNADYDSYGIHVTNSQNLTFDHTGDYLCTLSPEFYEPTGQSGIITFWYQITNSSGQFNDVAWSNSRYTLASNTYSAPAIPYQFDITNPAQDKVRFMWWSDNANTLIYSSGVLTSPSRPSIPGILLNCQKVSEVVT